MKKLIFFVTIASLPISHNYLKGNDIMKVAVFCSADNKVSEQFKTYAYNLGTLLGNNNFGLVTGGSCTGLMKEVVNGYVSVTSNIKNLYGIMPQVLACYDAHHRAIPNENLIWVDTIHIRLSKFHELSDVIVVLPGGFGTLHEMMDFLIHNQFALSKKPIILINYEGYWNSLLSQFKTMIKEQLLSPQHLASLIIVQSENECMQKLVNNELQYAEQGLNTRYWENKENV